MVLGIFLSFDAGDYRLIVCLALLFFLLVIGKIPKPTKEDIELRSERIR
jgi:hypothetical protein